jgi:outer membrane receptor protein involved in Fe transport
VKLTAGVRYTDDKKERTNLEVQLLAPDGAGGIGTGGYPANDVRRDEVGFEEVTGRFVVDWKPTLSVTDDSLFYASFSRGYKAGGFNSPEQGVLTIVPYKPEFINAFELGTKHVIGRSQFNLTGFYYDYTDYQISKVEQFSARNDNVDAEVMGIELETTLELADRFIVGANFTWLDTEIKNGRSVDPLDRNLGDPNLIVLRTFQAGCIAPVAQLEPLVAAINAGTAPAAALFNPCAGRASGVEADLTGNELPHSPKLSASLSAEYGIPIGSSWEATLRGFYSWKDDYYSSVFNGVSYELRSWDNASVTLSFARTDRTLELQLFGRNLLDDDTVVSYATGSDGLGLRRTLTLLEPRLFGLAITYRL